MSFLITLFIFGILIVVHEFGHFIAARRSGVRVEKFAIGFGPPLFKIRGKETEFLICLFPLGGYVKLAGDNRQEYKGQSYEFLSKPPGVRAKIVFSGVFFNYLFALAIFWTIALVGFPYQDTVVGGVFKDYPAYNSGLREGDRVIAVDGKEIVGWREMQRQVRKAKGEVLLTLERDDKLITLAVPLKREEITDEFGREINVSMIGTFPYYSTTIGIVEKSAKEAGLKQGDRVVAVNGIYVDSWKELEEIVLKAKEEVAVTIEREGETISLAVAVKQEEITNREGEEEIVSSIGIGPYLEVKFKRYPFFEGFVKGGETLFGLTADIITGFSSIISGRISFKEGAAGPIGIFYITSEYVKIGIIAVLQLMAALNISLAIINLFPIPVLDGGHLLFLFIEKLRKKALSEKAEEVMTRVGLTFIVLLIILVFYNDTIKYGPEILNKIRGKTGDSAQRK